ncbi:hypothetical protein TNCT_498891 [Trichonephila clavata]|uniref:OTU domain-containing protein n=1 Tax=Trichonephila clavata TaxID=2740835 RepID=A0A8X6F7N8_TRICU|nr:hypothetical protein TNCT_498891 [Trichonephila clavata]
MAIQIRKAIVRHVCNEWKRFKCFTQGPSGVPYGTKRLYYTEKSKPYTYGSISEVMAAGEIFPYIFQVYQDGFLIAVFGDALQGIRRLWSTENFNEGHFDALVPLDETMTNNIQLSEFNELSLLTSTEQIEYEKYFSCHHGFNCKSDVCKSMNLLLLYNQREEQNGGKDLQAQSDISNHPEVHRDAVQKYTQSHLEVNSEAVRKYTQRHPEVNRKTVKKYVSKNPHVARTKSNKCKEKISEIRLLPWTSKHLSAFKYKANVDYSMDEIVNLGPRLPCSWCRALKWKIETQGMCCSGGKVQLPNLEPYPEPLHSLLTHQDPLSEHFLSTIRKYNGCFQMISFGAKRNKGGQLYANI